MPMNLTSPQIRARPQNHAELRNRARQTMPRSSTVPLGARVAMIAAAVLCVAVSAIHVDDQGGVTAFTDPDWLGWAYRLLEISGLLVAGALVFAAGAVWTAARSRAVWIASILIGAGPFVGYLLSRTSGLPGSSDDIGNWSEQLGTVSLVVEGALVLLAVVALTSWAATTNPANPVNPATPHTTGGAPS